MWNGLTKRGLHALQKWALAQDSWQRVCSNRTWNSPFVSKVARTWLGESISVEPMHSSSKETQLFWTLRHWPWPQVMYILSNGCESNLQKNCCDIPHRSWQKSSNPIAIKANLVFFSKWCISFGQECMVLNHWVLQGNATLHAAFRLKESVAAKGLIWIFNRKACLLKPAGYQGFSKWQQWLCQIGQACHLRQVGAIPIFWKEGQPGSA